MCRRIARLSVSLLACSTATKTALAATCEEKSFPDIVARVLDGVVNIRTTDHATTRIDGSAENPMDLFFKAFLIPIPTQRTPQPRSLGSGFFYKNRDLVVTNYHVISDATEIRILTSRSTTPLLASVIGKDASMDMALLRVQGAPDGTTLQFDGSQATRLGETVFAIGNPFGYGHTVTRGILSAKGRSIGTGPFDDFLQTDAAINPGNSGGPLFNLCGHVIGINTAKDMKAQGISFAIPAEVAIPRLGSLIATGSIEQAWIGLSVSEVKLGGGKTTDSNQPAAYGLNVESVVRNSPAGRAGIRAGDIILAVNNQEVRTLNAITSILTKTRPGQPADLTIYRSKKGSSRIRLNTGKRSEQKKESSRTDGLGSAHTQAF